MIIVENRQTSVAVAKSNQSNVLFLCKHQYQNLNRVLAEVLLGQVQRGDDLRNTEQSV